ncbi:hypothetical protein ACQZV8_00930 [Magnetococcales bacterium HHB-1]
MRNDDPFPFNPHRQEPSKAIEKTDSESYTIDESAKTILLRHRTFFLYLARLSGSLFFLGLTYKYFFNAWFFISGPVAWQIGSYMAGQMAKELFYIEEHW